VWSAAPENELGAAVPVHLVLAHTESVAVALLQIVAFSTGFSFHLVVRRRHEGDVRDHRFFDDIHHPGTARPDALHFGVQYGDGRKATTMGSRGGAPPHERTDIVLSPGGGSGGPRTYDMHMWVWPLPPPGLVAFVSEWLAESIPLTRREVDAAAILDAARRSLALWPDESSDDGGARTAYGGFVDT
jgi:hypothetical protein